MNEEVKKAFKELATEVEHSHGAFGEYEQYRHLNADKLIELVVRKCAEVCSKIGYANISDCDGDKPFGYGANFCAHKIKEHFGVKE